MATKTPIPERTDENLVRTIAEWMGWNATPFWDQNDHGLGLSREPDSGLVSTTFRPHLLWGSADRERVMLAMSACKFNYVRTGDGGVLAEVEDNKTQQIYESGGPIGRAFCEAVVAWIEASVQPV